MFLQDHPTRFLHYFNIKKRSAQYWQGMGIRVRRQNFPFEASVFTGGIIGHKGKLPRAFYGYVMRKGKKPDEKWRKEQILRNQKEVLKV